MGRLAELLNAIAIVFGLSRSQPIMRSQGEAVEGNFVLRIRVENSTPHRHSC